MGFPPFHPLDLAYWAGVALASPYWLLKGKARRKVLGALRDRRALGLLPPAGDKRSPTVLLHAVSLGEINATRTLVDELLARRPDLRLVVTATTAAGFARATELYGSHPRISVDRYPLDFTPALTRFLDHYRPDVVVLMELELWPNFLRLCRRRALPVFLVNGRLTGHSLRRYRLIAPISRRMLRSLALLCVQDDTYRTRFVEAGADDARVVVTGTMKFDTAALSTDPAKVAALAASLGLADHEPLLLAASSGPGEEAIALRVYRELLKDHPALRLAVVPRKPERFDEVAALITAQGFPLVRRSNPDLAATTAPVLLGDTLGELRLFYARCSIAFVGRSLVDLGPKQHGSDMIESAALGKPTIVGPFTGNFADAMHLLKRHNAVVIARDEPDLLTHLRRLLAHPEEAQALATRAAQVVTQGRGATTRHADRILNHLPPERRD